MDKKTDLKNFITKISRGAGDILKEKFRNVGYVKFKDGLNDPVTDADYASEDYLISNIKKKFPEHEILSEEGGVGGSNGGDYLWILDPLDGTSNFSKDVPMFCVSVALAYKKEVIAGVVYDPIHEELFFAEKGKGAFLNGEKIEISKVSNPKKSQLSLALGGLDDGAVRKLRGFSKHGFRKIRAFGSAALALTYFAAGRSDAYICSGCHLWDVAAGIVIAREAGAKVTSECDKKWDIDCNEIVAANKDLHRELIKALN